MYVLIDNLFKIRFNGRFSQQYALHPPRYYLHVDWERLSDTQVIVCFEVDQKRQKVINADSSLIFLIIF